jgi:hypothetical protein
VLGAWSRQDTLYGTGGYSVAGNGDLAEQLDAAIRRLPERAPTPAATARSEPAPAIYLHDDLFERTLVQAHRRDRTISE